MRVAASFVDSVTFAVSFLPKKLNMFVFFLRSLALLFVSLMK
jgi:hypothetical protein